MRILISGAGLAGLTLAYWLYRYGFTPVVIEKADGLRRGGYGVDFAGTGYDVAERMGIIGRLQQQQLNVEGIDYVNSSGNTLARLNIQTMRQVMSGRYIGLMHWTLEETLYATVEKDVEVRFGTTITAVEQSPDAVSVTFMNGKTQAFDLVVGADGIHSNTRSLVFGTEAQFARYLGYYIAAYSLPDRYGIGNRWQNYAEPGRQVGAYGSDKAGEIMTLFVYKAKDEGPISPEQRLSKLQRAYKGMGWITDQLLADVTETNDIFMDTLTQIIMPQWHRGRVVLVGDACGCMTLISGQGASMALGGAYILAQALSRHETYEDAFQDYESQVRPAVELKQKKAQKFAKAFVPGSRLGLAVQIAAMKIMGQKLLAGLLKRQLAVDTILPAQEAGTAVQQYA